MEQEHKIQNIQIPSSLGYVDLLIMSGERFLGALKECKDCGLTSSWSTLQAHAKFTWMEMLCVVVCALAWTGLRKATTKWIFQVSNATPFALIIFCVPQSVTMLGLKNPIIFSGVSSQLRVACSLKPEKVHELLLWHNHILAHGLESPNKSAWKPPLSPSN